MRTASSIVWEGIIAILAFIGLSVALGFIWAALKDAWRGWRTWRQRNVVNTPITLALAHDLRHWSLLECDILNCPHCGNGHASVEVEDMILPSSGAATYGVRCPSTGGKPICLFITLTPSI